MFRVFLFEERILRTRRRTGITNTNKTRAEPSHARRICTRNRAEWAGAANPAAKKRRNIRRVSSLVSSYILSRIISGTLVAYNTREVGAWWLSRPREPRSHGDAFSLRYYQGDYIRRLIKINVELKSGT